MWAPELDPDLKKGTSGETSEIQIRPIVYLVNNTAPRLIS